VIRGWLLGIALAIATGLPAFAQDKPYFVVQSEVMGMPRASCGFA
jgi:hypothetical protein